MIAYCPKCSHPTEQTTGGAYCRHCGWFQYQVITMSDQTTTIPDKRVCSHCRKEIDNNE